MASIEKRWKEINDPHKRQKRTIELVQKEIYVILQSCNRQENISMIVKKSLIEMKDWIDEIASSQLDIDLLGSFYQFCLRNTKES